MGKKFYCVKCIKSDETREAVKYFTVYDLAEECFVHTIEEIQNYCKRYSLSSVEELNDNHYSCTVYGDDYNGIMWEVRLIECQFMD